ncbi:hypothetical protein HMPREF9200_0096 [Veillonella sp. oral taxon 780 str. F0422]|nr:hypothetical protein HMPREF9200_0096 [Veillonella sp. oral taxon 780 str. F0422]
MLDRILHIAKDCGLYLHGLTYSPIKGMEGNIEFLGYFTKQAEGSLDITEGLITATVEGAHRL